MFQRQGGHPPQDAHCCEICPAVKGWVSNEAWSLQLREELYGQQSSGWESLDIALYLGLSTAVIAAVWTTGKHSGFGCKRIDARLGLGRRKVCITHRRKRGFLALGVSRAVRVTGSERGRLRI